MFLMQAVARILNSRLSCCSYCMTKPRIGTPVRDIGMGAGSLGFDYRVGQVGCSIAAGSPLLQRFFRSCVAQELSRGDGPITRYTLINSLRIVLCRWPMKQKEKQDIQPKPERQIQCGFAGGTAQNNFDLKVKQR